ncbi:methyltransferase regulatory domain-containing protein [Herbaspirillum sp. SJZ099]|uniref:methyltransferase regulatory domain-containing protein n=1 Tax=Herbaspirillum sp. SJZ099 TaxID=2572916 RepID=UPI00119C9E1D|nr:class I SAM-dependent methyltransferase [Herbaspirillum sp. SJZ099]TWC65746.1 methyltransferase-like protein [Herbaspirillum sp. SJZ099]
MDTSNQSSIERTYDQTPYTSHPIVGTALEHLAAVAWLFGIDTPDPATAKVLELGSASGGNLIPHAQRHPEGHYLGIDLSQVQVDAGQRRIDALGLRNIALQRMSIADITPETGTFDYIICHGVYSWVPPEIQDHILRVCAQNLSPQGLAFVSYNTYPGWKFKETIRDAMLYRGSKFADPKQKLGHAYGMINFMREMTAPNSLMRQVLDAHAESSRGLSEDYLLHEYLELHNAPCYLSEFVSRAQPHGLAYFANSEVPPMFVSNLGPDAAQPLLRECGDDQVAIEQYIDFLTNRQFRQTLLLPAQRQSEIRYRLDKARLADFHYAGNYHTGAVPSTPDDQPQVFYAGNLQINVSHAIGKAALLALAKAFPGTLTLPQIVEAAQKMLEREQAEDADLILALLEHLLMRGLVRFRRQAVPASAGISKQPLAAFSTPADARLDPRQSVANLWHEHTTLNVIECLLLPVLDGQHTQTQLVEHLKLQEQQGFCKFMTTAGELVTDPKQIHACAIEHVVTSLTSLKNKAMLRTNAVQSSAG